MTGPKCPDEISIDVACVKNCFPQTTNLNRKVLELDEAALCPRPRKGASALCCSSAPWSG